MEMAPNTDAPSTLTALARRDDIVPALLMTDVRANFTAAERARILFNLEPKGRAPLI